MSIKKKLILMIMLLTIVPLVVLSVISSQYMKKSLEEEAIAKCRGLTNEIKLQIDGYLDVPFTAIKVAANNQAVQSFDLAQTKKFLTDTQKNYPDYAFTLNDAKGNMVVRGDDLPLTNIGERSYFQMAFSGTTDVISEVIYSKNGNRFVVNLATPVRSGGTGPVVGVLHATIVLTKLSEYVTEFSKNGSVAFVIDSTGKMLAHPNDQLVKDRIDMTKQDYVRRALDEKKDGFAVLTDEAGARKMVAYAYDKRTGWLICLEVPYSVITAKIDSLLLVLGGVSLIGLIIVGLLVVFSAARFVAPILQMQQVASKVAQGDLTQKANIVSKDEIGLMAQAFNLMVANLKKLIGQVQANSEKVAAASEELTATADQSAQAANQIATSINEVATGAEKQDKVVRETTAVVEEMSASIRLVAANTDAVFAQSSKAAEAAKMGGNSIETAVSQMRELERTVGDSAEVVARLGERSKEIGQIVGAISGIAGQTNLLALNAAIEAARAGEQGRGFAVVADEVRKLAEESQEAAKQIAAMISEIQSETDMAVRAMELGTQGVKAGTTVVNQAGQAFEDIIGLVTELADQVAETTKATQQLASGGQRIVSSVRKFEEMTRKAAGEAQTVSAATEEQSAAVEEIASSSQHLSVMAQNLQETVGKFRV